MTAENVKVRNCGAGVSLYIPDATERIDSTFTLGCLCFDQRQRTLLERLQRSNGQPRDTVFVVDRFGEDENPGIICSNMMCSKIKKV